MPTHGSMLSYDHVALGRAYLQQRQLGDDQTMTR